jgi:hypothetical protein
MLFVSSRKRFITRVLYLLTQTCDGIYQQIEKLVRMYNFK